ncbi:MAG: heme-binding domain-containing protein [Campylobacterales bacterium]|nr:heme-binding domain-containing protein [Campylobacterales bacterium]
MRNVFFIIIILFISLQLIQINKHNPTVDTQLEIKAPKEIMTIFKKACYDCHSNETKWPWYSSIAPMSWSISSHVEDGRKWLNFSVWENYSQEEKEKKIKEIFRAVYIAMPPSDYIYFHDEASLTKEERTYVRDWTGVMK